MFEYLASLYFGFILLCIYQKRNQCPSDAIKLMELILLLYITYCNPLLGVVCTMIFIQQCTREGGSTFYHTSSRLHVSEQLIPKQSNTLLVEQPSGLPPQESLTGQMSKPYSSEKSKYTPF